MPCAKTLRTMTVDVALCGSIPRSHMCGRARTSPVDPTVSKSDAYNMKISAGVVDAGGKKIPRVMGRVVISEDYRANCASHDKTKISRDPLKSSPLDEHTKPQYLTRRSVGVRTSTTCSEILTATTYEKYSSNQTLLGLAVSTNTNGTNPTISTGSNGGSPGSKQLKKLCFSLDEEKEGKSALITSESKNSIVTQGGGLSSTTMVPHVEFEVPSWAVPATGEARLEPVCEANGTHPAIDLTHRHVYYIGRSPSNHIILLHRTSSRRHALIFHHPCGACYLIDCRSAHGTYVNGNRIAPLAPCRIKRGSLVRFGGPGAPAYILKSFSSDFDRMVRDLGGVADAFRSDSPQSREVLMLEQQARLNGVACIRGDGGMACIVDGEDAPSAALVLLNTRLNACGGVGSLGVSGAKLARKACMHFVAKASSQSIGNKRMREDSEAVSPTKKLCTTRSILVHNQTKATIEPKRRLVDAVPPCTVRNDVMLTPRRVTFNDEKPLGVYPPPVTPEELSSDSECSECEEIERINLMVRQPIMAVGN